MSTEVEFDEEVVRAIEAIYRTPSMVERRERIRDALTLEPGERVLSIGTGPGFEAAVLAEAVGADGRVLGVDIAAPMLAAARQRCSAHPSATFELGDATDLPAAAGAYDAATAVQVFEYVPDLDDALAELSRAVRPGGRAVVFDSDWQTMTYAVDDEERGERLLRAFDAHCVHPRLALTLGPRLERAGFDVVRAEPYVHFETELAEDAVGGAFLPVVAEVATRFAGLDETEVGAWLDDVRGRAADGGYFFSFNQYLFLAEKPG